MFKKLVLIFTIFLLSQGQSFAQDLEILRVTPSGQHVTSLRQITFTFNQDVVPLGKMDRNKNEIPIKIIPKPNCQWRWISTSILACQLDDKDKLKKSTKYKITVLPGIFGQNVDKLKKEYNYEFTTQRPLIGYYVSFDKWLTPQKPSVNIRLNQGVTKNSLEEHIYFKSNGDRYEVNASKSRYYWLISPKKELEPDSKVDLFVEPGIKSTQGDEISQQHQLLKSFYTYDNPKLLGLRCYDNKNKSQTVVLNDSTLCSPDHYMELLFNTPVFNQDLFRNVTVISESGKKIKIYEPVSYEGYNHHRFHNKGNTYGVRIPIKFEAREKYNIKVNYGDNFESLYVVKQKQDIESKVKIREVIFAKEVNIFIRIWNWIKRLFGFGDASNIQSDDDAVVAKENSKSQCYWMENVSGKFIWILASKIYGIEISKRRCFELDGCNGGLNHSNGGCYKWADSPIGERYEWEINKKFDETNTSPQAESLRDIFGRKFTQRYDLNVKLGDYKPDYNLKYTNIVLEKDIDTIVSVGAVNLNGMSVKYDYIKQSDSGKSSYEIILSPLPRNQHQNLNLGIREMLNGESGLIYGNISTIPKTCNSDYCRKFSAQVTPYNILAKIGYFSSIAWVTDLSTGAPVANANISLYIGSNGNKKMKQEIASVKTNKFGIATLPGKNEFDPNQKLNYYSYYPFRSKDDIFIKVTKKKNIAILPVTSDFMVNEYRISGTKVHTSTKKEYGHILAWGTTAQGVYKKGDKVLYKIYVRDSDNNKLKLAKRSNYHIQIKDPTGKVIHEKKKVKLSEFSTIAGDVQIAKSAISGWYQVHLKSDYSDYGWYPLKFLVSDFTPAPFKVSNSLNGDSFYQGDEVRVETFAKLHSGGPYTDSAARIIAKVKEKTFTSKHPLAAGFKFDSYNSHYNQDTIFSKNDKVDNKGELESSFEIDKNNIYYGKISVESTVSDDRGKNISGTSYADYFAVNRFVGLKSTKWLYESGKKAEIKYIVVDDKGNPAGGSKVKIAIEHQDIKSIKVKSSGSSFVNKYTKEWVNVSECKSISSGDNSSICQFTPEKSGSYRLIATTKDTNGHLHKTILNIWVTGNDWVTWEQPNDNSLTIIPKSEEYNIGQKAKFLVKNPYPGSNALITIERYGVIKQWVQKLESNMPIIEFDVEPDFLPGFYLSVTVMSKRTDKPLSKEGLYLGKPAFKMGYLKVMVNDPYKKINVDIKTDKEVYKPGEQVKVNLKANTKIKNPGKMELTAVVIDESVFDMIQGGKSYYDLYQGLNKLDSLDLKNFNLIQRLVGRQKIEKKGSNPGGGGMSKMKSLLASKDAKGQRTNFSYIGYFNPSIVTNLKGEANFEFKLPDNLTGWKLLVLSTNKGDLLGLSDKSIKSNLPIEIRPVMPNQVREGDKFDAGFSIMNRTKEAKKIDVTIEAKGDIEGGLKKIVKTITLDPYKRQSVFMSITNKSSGQISFSAKASNGLESDSVSHEIKILRNRSLQTAANYGSTNESTIEEKIQFPKNIHSDIGKVDVVLSSTVIGNIDGSFKYIRDYPYTCWEQKLTKGVMASHYKNLSGYISDDIKWPRSNKLPQSILNNAYKFQAPNGGMTYFKANDRYVSPYLSAYSALTFNWLSSSNYNVDMKVEEKLHDYLLKNLLRHDISLEYYTKAMGHTVRSVALNALAKHNKITKNDILHYKEYFSEMDLFGRANFLQAAFKVAPNEPWIKKLVNNIISYSNQSAGKFTFSEELDSGYSRILSSQLRTNCAILSSLVPFANKSEYKGLLEDIPFKLVRTITASRGSKDHFNNTQENMFCANALIEYSKAFEKKTPNMSLKVEFNENILGNGVIKSFKDKPLTFAKSINDNDSGSKAKIRIDKNGSGRLYYTTRLSYASKEKSKDRINAGIDIRREYSVKDGNKWEILESSNEIKRGDLVKVDIYLSITTPRQFVVVDDPVISGLEPVNRDLANSSQNDANQTKIKTSHNSWYFRFDDWKLFNISRWSFYHKELGHDNVRFYSDYLEPGNYHLSYIAQAISTGSFSTLPVHGEEMYDPDVYGKGLGFTLSIKDE